jgi:CRP-like cAMP-binding protein
MFVYESIYKNIEYLQTRSSSFIAWICPNLKPYYQLQGEYIYFEGDDVTYIYFLNQGECGFVLPRHNNVCYVHFEIGSSFGLIDVIGSVMKYGIDFEEWMQYPEKIKRQFTVRSQTNCELLTITIKDLERMSNEFNDEYNVLFDNKVVRLNNVLKLKI